MARIIGLKEKQLALKEVNLLIKSLGPVNEFLSAENPTGEYAISFGEHKTTLLCENPETIRLLVTAYKRKIVDEINAKAKEFSLELDEDEQALLKLS